MNHQIPPLHYAVLNQTSDVELLQLLDQPGTDVNEPCNHDACTALHYAVAEGNLAAVHLLLGHGADVSLLDLGNQSALHYAASGDDDDDNLQEIARLLLEHGADCNVPEVNLATPFLWALSRARLSMVRLMLDHGADMMAVSARGETALHFAARNPRVELLQFVLGQRCFDVECGSIHDLSALHCAALAGNAAGCELLLRHGAMVNRRSDSGQTPLTIAVGPNCQEVRTIQVLLEHGADVGSRSTGGSVLEIAKDGNESVKYVLMRHIVWIECLDLVISEDDRRTIDGDECYREYYDTCLAEVKGMRKAKLYNSVCVFDILMGSGKVLSGYARNETLVAALWDGHYEIRFPIYFPWLKRRFDRKVERQMLQEPAAKRLATLFGFNDSYHPVNRAILDFLKDDDLLILGM